MASPDVEVPSRYSPDSDSDSDLDFTHLKTPNLDFPLSGGDIAEELSWRDVLIDIAGVKFAANSTKLKVVSVFFLGRLTTWSTEGEVLNGQHVINLASDDLLTPAAVAAVLTFVDGLFEGRYHTGKGLYDHSLAIKDLTEGTDNADALTAANATQVFRAAEFFQVRDLLPVCGDFIRREVVTKSNFIQILKEGTAGSFDALETYIGERFLVSTASKRRNKYGEFDLCLDYRGVYSIECHRRVICHYSTVLRNVIDRLGAGGSQVLTLDLEKHLGPDLEEALFVAVEFMYFKEMMDVPSEMLFKVLRVARGLNIVKVMESACALLNPATSEEWLCLYNTSRELRNPLIHRRVMLTFVKKFDAFSAAIERVSFEDLLSVVKSDLATVPEERLYSAVMRWRQPDTEDNVQKSKKKSNAKKRAVNPRAKEQELQRHIRKDLLDRKKAKVAARSGSGSGRRSWPCHLYLKVNEKQGGNAWAMWRLDVTPPPPATAASSQWRFQGEFKGPHHATLLNPARDMFYFAAYRKLQQKPHLVLHSFDPATGVCRRAIDTLDCPGKFNMPAGDTDSSCGRFILASSTAVSDGDGGNKSPAVPYASLIVSPVEGQKTSLQFVNFPELKSNGHWKGFSKDRSSEMQVLHHGRSKRTFIFGGVRRKEKEALMVTDITTARTLFVRDCPVRATFVEWGENILMIGGHESGGYETKGSVAVLDPSTMAPPAVSVAEDMLPDILPPLHNARYGASGVALPDGRVVVAGGFRWEAATDSNVGWSSVAVPNCEIFDPASRSWSVIDMPPLNGGGKVGSVKLFVVPKTVEEVDDQNKSMF